MAEHQTSIKHPDLGAAHKPGAPATPRALRKPRAGTLELGDETKHLWVKPTVAKRKAGQRGRPDVLPAASAPADGSELKAALPVPGDNSGTTDNAARTATDMGQPAPASRDNAAGMTAGSEPNGTGREKDGDGAQAGPVPVVGGEDAGQRQLTDLLSRHGAQADQILGEVARALEVAEQRRMAVAERLLAQQISIQQAWESLAQRQALIEAQLAALVANHR
jgi:hypothetical protein